MQRVNKNNPCPICGRPDGCLVEEDGSKAMCSRISEGSKKLVGEPFAGGWLHILIDRPLHQRRRYVKKPPPGPAVNWEKLVAEYCVGIKETDVSATAKMFGVSMKALDELLIGWDPQKEVHTFPMLNGKGYFIGIRLRALDGKQWSVTGSKNGIFWPTCVAPDADDLFFIGEGPTDCAALLDLGFSPIGRASCGTGYQYIKEMIEHYNRQVVIFSDKDEAKFTPDGRKFFPGYDGGLKLARSIKPFVSSVRLIKPPEKKDIRAWYQAGATRAAVLALVKNAKFI